MKNLLSLIVRRRNFSLNQKDFNNFLDDVKEVKKYKKNVNQSISDLACILHIHHGAVSAKLDEIQNQTKRIENEVSNLKNILSHVTAGLGIKFETFNKAWIEHFLSVKGVPYNKIIQGHREPNVGQWTEIEIDLFSLDPPLIVECTSFVDEDEFNKVVKLVQIRDILSERYDRTFETFLTALAIHHHVREPLISYCREHNVTLITQFS